jgi:hypothetical protein
VTAAKRQTARLGVIVFDGIHSMAARVNADGRCHDRGLLVAKCSLRAAEVAVRNGVFGHHRQPAGHHDHFPAPPSASLHSLHSATTSGRSPLGLPVEEPVTRCDTVTFAPFSSPDGVTHFWRT